MVYLKRSMQTLIKTSADTPARQAEIYNFSGG